MVQLRWGVVCIKGNFRSNNEDAFAVDEQGRFFLVADGMGGQNAGERASHIATELIPQTLTRELNFESDDADEVVAMIDEAVRVANREILRTGENDPGCKNMGTTIVFQVAAGGQQYIGNIGDSRAYRLHDGEFTLLTRDHTLTAALVEAGTITPEEAKTHRYQNMLHRYLGSPEGNRGTNAKAVSTTVGDRYLLCSDGVTGGVEDEDLKDLLAAGDDPQTTAEKIVKAAEDGGSKDNITCIVIDVTE